MSSRSTAKAKARQKIRDFIGKHTKKGRLRPTKICKENRSITVGR